MRERESVRERQIEIERANEIDIVGGDNGE